MNTEKQIKALAELDGFSCCCKDGKWDTYHGDYCCEVHGDNTKPYLTSYDAIIPLIRKQLELDGNVLDRFFAFIEQPSGCTGEDLLSRSPAQLCKALLKVTGKWEE